MLSISDAILKITGEVFPKIELKAPPSDCDTKVYFLGKESATSANKKIQKEVPDWQYAEFEKSKTSIFLFSGSNGPIWVLRPFLHETDTQITGHHDRFVFSDFGAARDLAGSWARQLKEEAVKSVAVQFVEASADQVRGVANGLGLGRYKYTKLLKAKKSVAPRFYFSDGDSSILAEAEALANACNISRHLTNMPARELNPETFSQFATHLMKKLSGTKVEVWNEARLKKEKMGLLIGVGEGSETGSRLVHVRYRPAGAKGQKPRAFVGKGVTFDTGGLDIKPSSGMRFMKKDMSGAGTVLSLAYYVAKRKLKVPCDFYLALAENAISEKATRPGDVHIARNGQSVEIHNTDAEGRLAMADALDVAVTQKGSHEPCEVIDVSTLTGAMRVSLGLDVAGFFSNSDDLADDLERASRQAGEMAWRMPLIKKYKNQLNSNFADLSNCADTGFGGAISAALFLEYFVRAKPWAHFDVMSWNGSAQGAMSDGGNAQSLQILAQYLESKNS